MQPVIRLVKKQWIFLLIGLFVYSGSISVLHPEKYYIEIEGGIIAGLVLLYFLLYNKKWFIYICTFSIPFSIYQNIGTSEVSIPSELFALLLATFYIGKNLVKFSIPTKILFHPITILLILQIIWLFITSCTSTYPLISFKRTLITVMYIVVYFFVLAEFFSERKNIIIVFSFYALGMTLPICTSIIRHAQYNFSPMAAYDMCYPFFNDHTIYGACLAFLIPLFITFFIKNKQLHLPSYYKITTLILSCILTIAVVFSFSRAAWLGLIISLLFSILIYFKITFKVLLSLLGMVTIILIFSFNSILNTVKQNEVESAKKGNGISQHIESVTNVETDVSNLERINRWKCALRMFEQRPLVGFGPGTYQFNYGNFQVKTEMTRISTYTGNKGHAHSEYLNALSETGFIGALIFTLFVFFNLATGLRVIYKSEKRELKLLATAFLLGQLTYFVHAFFNGFLDIDKMAMLVYGSSAVLVSLDVYTSNPANKVLDQLKTFS